MGAANGPGANLREPVYEGPNIYTALAHHAYPDDGVDPVEADRHSLLAADIASHTALHVADGRPTPVMVVRWEFEDGLRTLRQIRDLTLVAPGKPIFRSSREVQDNVQFGQGAVPGKLTRSILSLVGATYSIGDVTPTDEASGVDASSGLVLRDSKDAHDESGHLMVTYGSLEDIFYGVPKHGPEVAIGLHAIGELADLVIGRALLDSTDKGLLEISRLRALFKAAKLLRPRTGLLVRATAASDSLDALKRYAAQHTADPS